jgi:uncharacterized delta-60 repeat protein
VQHTTAPYVTEQVIGVVRYNANGSLDASFGGGGKVTTTLGSGSGNNGGAPFSGADAIALGPDGRIVVGGFAVAGGGPDFLLVRYDTDGGLDATFAQGGIAFSTDFGAVKGLAVQPDGTVVGVGSAGNDTGLAVVSYAPDGRRDVAFLLLGANTTAAGVAVGPDGGVVTAGSVGIGARNVVLAHFLNRPPPPPLFVVGTDGSLSGRDYTAPGWATLSPAGTIVSVSAVTDAAGISDVFAITTTGNSLWERTASGWVDLSDGAFRQISATTDAAGHAVVFGVLGPSAGVYADSLWEHHDDGWSELAGYGLAFLAFQNGPGDVQYVSATHTAQGEAAYAIASGGALFRYTPSGGWQEVSTGRFAQVSAGLNGAGQAVVYGVLSDGSLWEQNPAFGPIGLDAGWRQLSGAGTTLSVAAGGPDEAFAIPADHTLWEHSASGWTDLSAGSFAGVSARRTPSGADEVAGTLTDGSLWEYSNGGGFSPTWQELLPGGVASSAAP